MSAIVEIKKFVAEIANGRLTSTTLAYYL